MEMVGYKVGRSLLDNLTIPHKNKRGAAAVIRASYCPMSRLSECKIASLRDGYTHLRNVLLCMSSGYEGSHRKRMSTWRKRKR